MPWGWGWRPGWGRSRGWWGGVQYVLPAKVPEGAKPLALLPPGSRGRIVAVAAGHGASMRAMSLGLVPGTLVEVVENNMEYPWSPVIVRVHGVEIALGRGLAMKIFVLPESNGGGREPS